MKWCGVLNYALTELHVGDYFKHDWYATTTSKVAMVTLLIVWRALAFVGDESVESVTQALVAPVAEGRLREERLAEAANRVRRTAAWASQLAGDGRVQREIGRTAARRALRREGNTVLSRSPFVVEMTQDRSIAAGKAPFPSEWLRHALQESAVVHVTRATSSWGKAGCAPRAPRISSS